MLSRPRFLTCALWLFQKLKLRRCSALHATYEFSSSFCCLALAQSYSVGRAIRSNVQLPSAVDCRLPTTDCRSSIFAPCKPIQDSLAELDWIPGCEFRIPGTGFRIPCQWNLDSRLQSLARFEIPLARFRIPKSRVPLFTSKNFSYSGNRIPLHWATRQRKKIPVFFFSFPLTWLDDRYIFSLVIDVLQNGENSSTILDETSRRESAPTLPPKTYPMNKKRHSIHDIPDSAPPLPPRSPVSPRSSLFFSGMFIIIIFLFQIL